MAKKAKKQVKKVPTKQADSCSCGASRPMVFKVLVAVGILLVIAGVWNWSWLTGLLGLVVLGVAYKKYYCGSC